jgi:hypothetical protein
VTDEKESQSATNFATNQTLETLNFFSALGKPYCCKRKFLVPAVACFRQYSGARKHHRPNCHCRHSVLSWPKSRSKSLKSIQCVLLGPWSSRMRCRQHKTCREARKSHLAMWTQLWRSSAFQSCGRSSNLVKGGWKRGRSPGVTIRTRPGGSLLRWKKTWSGSRPTASWRLCITLQRDICGLVCSSTQRLRRVQVTDLRAG